MTVGATLIPEAATESATIPIERLRGRFRGALLRSGEEGYDEARRVWNGAIDRRPASFPTRVTRPRVEDAEPSWNSRWCQKMKGFRMTMSSTASSAITRVRKWMRRSGISLLGP